MDFVPFLALVALTKKSVDFIKELLPNDVLNKVIQLVAVAIGIVWTLVFAASDWGPGISVGGIALSSLDLLAQCIVGATLGAGAGLVNDAIERRNPDADPDPPLFGNRD